MHSSVARHSDCLYILAIVHNAAVNIEVHYLFELVFSFSLAI